MSNVDACQIHNSEQYNRIAREFERIRLIVLDFSAFIVLSDSHLLQFIISSINKRSIDVMVTPEFYLCYNLLKRSDNKNNDTEESVLFRTENFINNIRDNLRSYNSRFPTTESLITEYSPRPDVLFMFADNSEASELFRNANNNRAVALFGSYDGRYECLQAGKYIISHRNDSIVEYSKEPLNVISVPSAGEYVDDCNGNKIFLSEEISKGGEGTVYHTNKNNYVCKIYHAHALSKYKCEKLKHLEKRQIKLDGICWPETIVYDSDNNPVGYLMKKANGINMSVLFDGDETITSFYPHTRRSDLVKICVSLLEKYLYLHLFGIIVGDIRMQNIIIDDQLNTFLIDLDSCQIDGFPCEVGDEEYTPVELQEKDFSSVLRTFKNERFAWSVICFNALFCGLHPYAQKNGLDTFAEEIASHTFKYSIDNDEGFKSLPPGCYAEIWKITPKNIKEFFYDVFKLDKRIPISTALSYYYEYLSYLNEPKTKNTYANRVNPTTETLEDPPEDPPNNSLRTALIVLFSVISALLAVIVFILINGGIGHVIEWIIPGSF